MGCAMFKAQLYTSWLMPVTRMDEALPSLVFTSSVQTFLLQAFSTWQLRLSAAHPAAVHSDKKALKAPVPISSTSV